MLGPFPILWDRYSGPKSAQKAKHLPVQGLALGHFHFWGEKLVDIEVVFLYPWALVFQDFIKAQGMLIFYSFLGFVGILFVAYLYALKKKALDWVS